ncbi:MAG TPA: thrombospondin type 3 repeat-containing protein [Candidatus Polarisedimenticolaceae bacterium]|nr:thrombospondin type 3 repeat-containing protein [Candidatus Polarisedimenticolaceae bacterium]
MLKAPRALVLVLALTSALACQTVADPFPPQSAVTVTITDTAVASQRFPLPQPQIAIWAVDEVSVHDLTNFNGAFDFLRASPCTYQLNALAPIALASACRMSGLSLLPVPTTTGKIRISISSLELRAAARPDLSPGGDPDGDGVPTQSDNCPIIFNPDQKNTNAATEIGVVGDACSDLDTATPPAPTIPDEDMDGVRDAVDNCLWYPNPLVGDATTQPDQNRDGIGDACERIAPVILPGGRLTVECTVTFKLKPSAVSIFRLDFGRPGVLTCDAAFTGCSINTTALKLELVGSTSTFDCLPK